MDTTYRKVPSIGVHSILATVSLLSGFALFVWQAAVSL